MKPTAISLTAEEQDILESWVRATKTEQRKVLRARIILAAGQGQGTGAIARQLGVRPSTVSKWRLRFAWGRLARLEDVPRPGKPQVYGQEAERRVLAKLDEPAPEGYAKWNGRLLAEALGDISKQQVWRILSKHGISLERRRPTHNLLGDSLPRLSSFDYPRIMSPRLPLTFADSRGTPIMQRP